MLSCAQVVPALTSAALPLRRPNLQWKLHLHKSTMGYGQLRASLCRVAIATLATLQGWPQAARWTQRGSETLWRVCNFSFKAQLHASLSPENAHSVRGQANIVAAPQTDSLALTPIMPLTTRALNAAPAAQPAHLSRSAARAAASATQMTRLV